MELLTVFFLGTERNGGCAERARWCPSQIALLGTQMLSWLCKGSGHSPERGRYLPPCNATSFWKRAKADCLREKPKEAALEERRNMGMG